MAASLCTLLYVDLASDKRSLHLPILLVKDFLQFTKADNKKIVLRVHGRILRKEFVRTCKNLVRLW